MTRVCCIGTRQRARDSTRCCLLCFCLVDDFAVAADKEGLRDFGKEGIKRFFCVGDFECGEVGGGAFADVSEEGGVPYECGCCRCGAS